MTKEMRTSNYNSLLAALLRRSVLRECYLSDSVAFSSVMTKVGKKELEENSAILGQKLYQKQHRKSCQYQTADCQ